MLCVVTVRPKTTLGFPTTRMFCLLPNDTFSYLATTRITDWSMENYGPLRGNPMNWWEVPARHPTKFGRTREPFMRTWLSWERPGWKTRNKNCCESFCPTRQISIPFQPCPILFLWWNRRSSVTPIKHASINCAQICKPFLV